MKSFLADGIPSFRKLFQFGWRLYGGFDQTLHRTRNMTKKDGEIFRDIGRTLHRIRREAADGWGFLLSVELNSPTNLVTVENGWKVLLKQTFHSPSNLATTGNSWRVLPKVLPIAWTRVETERWDPVTGRTHACTPDERGIVPSKMAAPLDGHCLRSFVGGYDTSQGSQTPDWTAFHWHSGDGINESVS